MRITVFLMGSSNSSYWSNFASGSISRFPKATYYFLEDYRDLTHTSVHLGHYNNQLGVAAACRGLTRLWNYFRSPATWEPLAEMLRIELGILGMLSKCTGTDVRPLPNNVCEALRKGAISILNHYYHDYESVAIKNVPSFFQAAPLRLWGGGTGRELLLTAEPSCAGLNSFRHYIQPTGSL